MAPLLTEDFQLMHCWGKCNSGKCGGLYQDLFSSESSCQLYPQSAKRLCKRLPEATLPSQSCRMSSAVCLSPASQFSHLSLDSVLRLTEVPTCPVISVSPLALVIFLPFLVSTPTAYGDFHLGTCPLVEYLQRLGHTQGYYTVNSYSCESVYSSPQINFLLTMWFYNSYIHLPLLES